MKDKCIICNDETIFDNDEHIDKRNWYVEGAGQLCEDCYNSIYFKHKVENYDDDNIYINNKLG